jgi:hypothetical protein
MKLRTTALGVATTFGNNKIKKRYGELKKRRSRME